MNSHLENLHQSYVFAYILNYQPPTPSNDKGVMTIVDNSENNVVSLLSQYGFYIDNVFIAGGYGFRTLEELKTVKDVANNFDEFNNTISYTLNDLQSRKTIFEFKGIEESEIGSQATNLNILSPEYNSYHFITSYQYFKVTENNSQENSNNKYILSINTQSDIKYIDNINIVQNNDDNSEIIDIEDITTVNIQKYKVKVDIHQNTSSNIIKYNDDLKLYVYSKLTEDGKNTAITLTDNENISIDKEFNKPLDNFKDDLVIEIRKPSSVINEETVVYSYIISDFLRWQDKFVIYPMPGTSISNNYNDYNFRDTGFEIINNEDAKHTYEELIQNNFISNNFINVDNNQEIELIFSSNDPCYDYIIFRNLYDIEFYFNGLQSHNWEYQTLIYGGQIYYIWQSPQRYYGKHIWKIKINMK